MSNAGRAVSCPTNPLSSTSITQTMSTKPKPPCTLEHKPGETMQVDWAGQTAALVDTDTGERLDAYLFVAVLPYSGYAYTEAFLDMKQEAWITGHVNAYRYFGAASPASSRRTTSRPVLSRTPSTETVLNKSYQEMAEQLRHRHSSGPSPQSQGQGLCGGFRWRGLYLDPGGPA